MKSQRTRKDSYEADELLQVLNSHGWYWQFCLGGQVWSYQALVQSTKKLPLQASRDAALGEPWHRVCSNSLSFFSGEQESARTPHCSRLVFELPKSNRVSELAVERKIYYAWRYCAAP